MLKKIRFCLLFFLFFLIFVPKFLLAAGEFNISQNITYAVDLNGDAVVNQKVQLTNNLSEIYPQEYEIKLQGADIKNIKASDYLGDIVTKVEQNNDVTDIFLKFNQTNTGKNKTTEFNTSYQIPKFAVRKGNVWEIILPDYQNTDSTDQINLTLLVPLSFGTLSFSSINSPSALVFNNQTQIQLNNLDIKNKKILFAFGNNQIFDFDLKYFIDNPTNEIVETEIAFLPQTDNQKIVYRKVNPAPKNVRIDEDGNWLAQYQLKPKEKVVVLVSGQAKIFSSKIVPKDINEDFFLKEQNFWPVNSSIIQKIAQNLKTPHDIYNYVVSNLSYDYDHIDSAKRKGALEAIENPSKSFCTEFTDLFVTLARAKKIPAREIEGFAYTNNLKIKPINTNTDVLHAWPQYYDFNRKSWISIDPTWAKTTNGIDYFNDLDLNHLIFAIHGIDSQYPPPAGSYKENGEVKTVEVKFASKEILPTFLSPKVLSVPVQFGKNQKIIVNNPNFNALSNISINLKNQNWSYLIETLPPFGSTEIEIPKISFFQSLLLRNRKNNFQIQFDNNDGLINYSTICFSHYLNLTVFITVLVLILSLGGIILTSKKKT